MIPPEELLIEAWPYSVKGGQHAGVRPGVKITHLPTGTVAICELARSQHKNKNIALEMIVCALTSPT